jgi:hypothetical protein
MLFSLQVEAIPMADKKKREAEWAKAKRVSSTTRKPPRMISRTSTRFRSDAGDANASRKFHCPRQAAQSGATLSSEKARLNVLTPQWLQHSGSSSLLRGFQKML